MKSRDQEVRGELVVVVQGHVPRVRPLDGAGGGGGAVEALKAEGQVEGVVGEVRGIADENSGDSAVDEGQY